MKKITGMERENDLLRGILRKVLGVAPESSLPWNGEIGRFGAIPITDAEAELLQDVVNGRA